MKIIQRIINWLKRGTKMEIKKDQITNINFESTTNNILIDILKELKDINISLAKYEVIINNHEIRITKIRK